jgi:hypothetical protein
MAPRCGRGLQKLVAKLGTTFVLAVGTSVISLRQDLIKDPSNRHLPFPQTTTERHLLLDDLTFGEVISFRTVVRGVTLWAGSTSGR